MTFYDYGLDIEAGLTQWCATQATRDARSVHGNVWNEAIGRSELIYKATRTSLSPIILLSVLPESAMTWNMLFYAATALQEFLVIYQSMALYFEVEVTSVQGSVAKGNITSLPAKYTS